MATKTYNLSWMRQYKASTNSYYGSGSPIRVGSSADYQSFLGIPTSVRSDLKASKSSTTMKLKIYITDPTTEWDVGRHKESGSSEPTYSTMPWYNYLKAVHYSGDKWLTIDLTSDFMNDYKNGTYQGLVLYGSTSNLGVAENSGANRAVIEITGDWNDPPATPVITYPQGGEIVDSSITVKWNPASDPDGDSLKYQVAFMDGDGVGWTYYETGYGVTQYTINTASAVEGSRARVAVRASDGQEWGAYTYSNYFTIDHNQPPSPPTQLSPINGAVIDRTGVIRFSWKHNDDGAQAGYRIAWRTVASDGTRGAWNYIPSSTAFTNSTNQYYDMPANTLPFGDIEWTVQTKDQQGEQSAYATYIVFKASEPTNAPIFLSPENMGYVNTTRVTVQWSSLNQLEYELILYDTNGVQLWSELKASNIKLKEIPVDLTNNTWYEIHLRVKDSTNLIWSDYSVLNFGTQFTPPHPPVVKRVEGAGSGVLNVFYSSADSDILPDFLVGEGERNDKLTNYGTTQDDNFSLLGTDSVQVQGALHGVEFWLKTEDIPLVTGAVYEFSANIDVKGGRLFIGAYDSARTLLTFNSTSADYATSPTGLVKVTLPLPANTVELRVILYTTWDNASTVTFSNAGLKIQPTTVTNRIEIFRREYTPTGIAPWIKIGTNLSTYGAFLDYTPASGVVYEYKVQAVNDGNKTSSDSAPVQAQSNFTETFIQEAHNLSSIISLTYATSKELELGIESQLQRFAGRRDPVREFGEHEDFVIAVEWEVDSYQDVKFLRDMWRRRDILLFRDMNGRRYWVTSDKLTVKDKPINGFVVSTEFVVTSYNEDLDSNEEELIQ
jgi:hypothetical protein